MVIPLASTSCHNCETMGKKPTNMKYLHLFSYYNKNTDLVSNGQEFALVLVQSIPYVHIVLIIHEVNWWSCQPSRLNLIGHLYIPTCSCLYLYTHSYEYTMSTAICIHV